jgi:hypothetical protein
MRSLMVKTAKRRFTMGQDRLAVGNLSRARKTYV